MEAVGRAVVVWRAREAVRSRPRRAELLRLDVITRHLLAGVSGRPAASQVVLLPQHVAY